MNRTADIAKKRQFKGFLALYSAKIWAWIWPNQTERNSRFSWIGLLGARLNSHPIQALESNSTRGGSRIFATYAYIQNYTWCIFRLRQFSKSDQGADHKVNNTIYRSFFRNWPYNFCKWLSLVLWLLLILMLSLSVFVSRTRGTLLAGQVSNRSQQVLVARVGVDGRGENRLVPGESLGDANIASTAIEIAASSVLHRMNGEPSLKTSALLPNPEGMSELTSRETLIPTAYKKRSGFEDVLSLLFFPTIEFHKLRTKAIGKQDFLVVDIFATAFEDSQLYSSSSSTVGIEDVANIQSENFMFSKARSQRQAEDHVVAKTCLMFAASLEQKPLFNIGQCFRWLGNGIGIVHVKHSSGFVDLFTQGHAFTAKAREAAVYFEVVEPTFYGFCTNRDRTFRITDRV